MNQFTFRLSAHLAFVHLLRKTAVHVRVAWRDLKRFWVEAIVIALLLLAGIAIRIASMAAANPAVAQALSHGTRLLAPTGTQF
jgi:hypothetical protein